MQFILTGFSQEMAFRVFAFERMGSDRVRTKYAVKADLSLVRRYGIQMQELPLLCRNLLVRSDSAQETDHTLTFTEDDMNQHAKGCAAAKYAAAQKRKPSRRPASVNVGTAWRGHHPGQTASTQPSTAAAAAGQAGGLQGIDGQKIIEAT